MKAIKPERGNFQKQLDQLVTEHNEQAKIVIVTDTALAVTQTNTLLNGKYPGAAIHSRVYAPNVSTGMMYTKITANGWASQAITILA